jgi:hypothetical protein
VLNGALFDVIGKRLVFPGATVSVLPGEIEATLAPGERLTIIGSAGPHPIAGIVRPPMGGRRWIAFFYASTQSSSLALREPKPAGGRNERSAQGAECIPVPCSSVK